MSSIDALAAAMQKSIGANSEVDKVSAWVDTTYPPERLRYIASLGLVPGARVTVVDRQPFDDLVTIEVAGQQHVIGRELGHVLQCAKTADV